MLQDPASPTYDPVTPCLDCGGVYGDLMALDLVLSKAQWLLIHPGDGGLLCALCILRRAEKLPHVINVKARITFGHEYDRPGGPEVE